MDFATIYLQYGGCPSTYLKKKKKMMPSKLELLVVSWKTWMAQIFLDSFLDVVDILGSSA